MAGYDQKSIPGRLRRWDFHLQACALLRSAQQVRRPAEQLSLLFFSLLTNPPYGERIEEKKNLPELYKTIGERFAALDSWSAYIITAYEDTERYLGRKADKNRKIYNGMMKTYFYQYMGPKPPRRNRESQ